MRPHARWHSRTASRTGTTILLSIALALVGSPRGSRAAAPDPDTADGPEETETRDNPQLQRAMQAYERGVRNYNEARYEEALADFQEASTLFASPDFQYNIVQCYEKLDKPEEAIRAFETYLRAKPEASDRANVEDRIRRLRERQEMLAAGQTPPPPAADPPAPQPETPRDDTPKNPGRALVIAGAALSGVGVGLALGAGIGFGVQAKQRSDDLKALQSGDNPDDLTFEDAQALEDEGQRFEVLQIAMAAAGGVVAVTGIALLALGLRKKS